MFQMCDYEEAYRIGYEEGIIIGKLEVYLSLVKQAIKNGVTDNYEEALKLYNISEENRARMMDYLPVYHKTWVLPSDLEWEARKELLENKLEEICSSK